MEPNSEVRALILRLDAMSPAETLAVMDTFVSHEPGTVGIGSDPGEWWQGYDEIRRASSAQVETGNQPTTVHSNPQAFSEGTVAWFSDQAAWRLADGREIPFRVTGVLHREDGAWKFVQTHWSIGIPNEEGERYAVSA